MIGINKDKEKINVSEIMNKDGNYDFGDRLIALRSNLFFENLNF